MDKGHLPEGSELNTPAIPDLNVTELLAVLKQCVDSGVVSLQWRGLQVAFAPSGKREGNSDPNGSLTRPPLTDEQHAAQSKTSLEEDVLIEREERLAMAVIEDPSAFEEMLRGDDLDDDESDNDDPDEL